MVTYTDEELEEYLIENGSIMNDPLEIEAGHHGFSWDKDIERWIAL